VVALATSKPARPVLVAEQPAGEGPPAPLAGVHINDCKQAPYRLHRTTETGGWGRAAWLPARAWAKAWLPATRWGRHRPTLLNRHHPRVVPPPMDTANAPCCVKLVSAFAQFSQPLPLQNCHHTRREAARSRAVCPSGGSPLPGPVRRATLQCPNFDSRVSFRTAPKVRQATP